MTPQTLGGLAVKSKTPPALCPRCLASMRGKSWHGYLGHMGLHGAADRFTAGDISEMARRLARNALAREEFGASWSNGAWLRMYKKHKPYQAKGATVKTNFDAIELNKTWHRYFYQGKELTSVTKKINQLQKPFDREGIGQRVADREGRELAEVLAEWDAKGEAARTLGTAVHTHIEKVLKGQIDPRQVSLDLFLDLNPVYPEVAAFNNLWAQLSAKVFVAPEKVEWVVGDAELGLAGTIDSVLFSDETDMYHIWDWKTGKFELNNQWENLLPPFDYLDASKLHVYSLQTSLYRLILERNCHIKMGDSYIVHLSENGFKVHRAVDLREPLLEWLTNG